ncbi:MAG TPA: hypothetical protein PLV42_09630 [bacterium]|nr:hypothetical protein [bacterium]
MTPEFERIIAAKEKRRKDLAALSFPEKVAIVVLLQKMVAPIWKGRGREVHVWQIPAANDQSVLADPSR